MGAHRSFRLPLRGADLTGLLEHRLLILRRDPDARVRHRDLAVPFARPAPTPIRPPSGVNFTAFESRFGRTWVTVAEP